jgi:LysR family glycine cleavage system transcriptional activator
MEFIHAARMGASRTKWAALEAFRHAVSEGSFQAAARRLGITPSAVSHQVRGLEAALGTVLFNRGVRSVALTAAGAELAASVETSFRALEAALDRHRALAAPARLRISALPLFTSAWLIPRLARFEAAHPGLAIEIETANRLADLVAGEADIAIRNVDRPGPGLAARKLLDLRAVPLCAPALARSIKAPADLAGQLLIHHAARPDGWPRVLAALGVGKLQARRDLRFDTLPAALEAAALGQGVALGLDPLVWDTVAPGSLVVPFAVPAISGGSYILVHRRPPSRAEAAFAAWITAEMAADRPRLRHLRQGALPLDPVVQSTSSRDGA